jgi:signal transduction histidine kinase
MRVDATLRVIIVGFRVVAAVWITVLGIFAVVSRGSSAGIVAAAVAVAWLWTGLTVIVARMGKLDHLGWLIADLAVAGLIVIADSLDGEGVFIGGFPTTSVLLWGYAYGIPGGLGSAALLSGAIVATGDYDFAGAISNIVLYLAVGGVAAWAFQVLRANEQRRLEAEAALAEERATRIRVEERAEMAAHLHDSVLQTLALIQKAPEVTEVHNLARGQERELRSWLLGANDPEATLGGALEQVCSEAESRFGIRVELVTAGDRRLDDRLLALVAATGEAVTNAAKHAGVDEVAVFADAGNDPVVVFIRDRGAGFDPEAVATDRRGLAESVVGRMTRNGGEAQVISAPGQGTEVRLSMPVSDGADQSDD